MSASRQRCPFNGRVLAAAGCAMLLLGADATPGGCARAPAPATNLPASAPTPAPATEAVPETPVPTETPTATPTSTPEIAEPTPASTVGTPPPGRLEPPAPLLLPLTEGMPLRNGWAVIVEKADPEARAWVEGAIHGGDRLEIRTHNIARFDLHLPKLHLNWEDQIVLRMDGFNSQLTRKRWPVLRFQNTSAGAWITLD